MSDAHTSLSPAASPTLSAGRSSAGIGRSVKDIGRTVVRALAMATADVRVLPDVVIIGVKRGGTTSLFRDLEEHPSMCPLVPSARRLPLRENMKGVHYFDTNSHRSARWYRSHFASRVERWRVAQRAGAAFTAEASPYYLFHPLAAQRAAEMLPESTKFVILLRDPVERTVSHWSEQTRNGVETLTLREALDAESDRLGDDAARLAAGAIDTSHPHEQQSYAAQSFYAASIRRWFDAVGSDRIAVCFSEDYYADAATTVRTVTDLIDVPVAESSGGEHRNAAPRASTLDADIEAALIERFRPDVAAVSELLGVTPPWPRFAGTTPVTGRSGR